MVSSDKTCLPSVKSTISIANDLKFIIYVRLIESLNHKYNLYFSLSVLPLFIWVMIFWRLFNQQFLKVKPQEEIKNGLGKNKRDGYYCCLLVYRDFSLTKVLSACAHFPCIWYTATIRRAANCSFRSSIDSLSECQCFPHRQEPFNFHKRVRSLRNYKRHLNQQ